jgi:hypothetical protein
LFRSFRVRAVRRRAHLCAPGVLHPPAVPAILRKRAFYTGRDPVQMGRLIRGSALASSKFDERRGAQTWIGREILRAIAATPEVYNPAGEGRFRPPIVHRVTQPWATQPRKRPHRSPFFGNDLMEALFSETHLMEAPPKTFSEITPWKALPPPSTPRLLQGAPAGP